MSTDAEVMAKWMMDPFEFISDIWHLEPCTCRAEFVRGKTLTHQQTRLVQMVKDAINGRAPNKIAVASGHGCFAPGTMVRMFDGSTRRVEDVRVGDAVMGDDGTARTVLELKAGRQEMYRVSYRWGKGYDVNADHKLVLFDVTNDEKIEVTVKDYVTWSHNKKKLHLGMIYDGAFTSMHAIKARPIGEGQYYGFTITGNHRFLLADGSVVRNTGKTSSVAMLVIWFVVTRFDAQVAATAPSSGQIKNSLWKELSIWLDRMPDELKCLLEITDIHFRVKERPKSWFAQARTASKEKPEALQGIHGDHVMIVVDEASGVIQEVFNAASGSLTGPEVLVLYLSQHTRLVGEFHDAMTEATTGNRFQRMVMDSEDSPIVEDGYCEDVLKRCFGDRNADEYRIRVKGLPPAADGVDDDGYRPLLAEQSIRELEDVGALRRPAKLGVDPAGDGRDEAVWVLRDPFRARVVAVEKISSPMAGAARTMDIMDAFGIDPSDVLLDGFGVGAEWVAELAAACARDGRPNRPRGVNVGEQARDPSKFANRKAECYWALRQWLIRGGDVKREERFKQELLSVRYIGMGRDQIKIMGKKEMREKGFKSPGRAEAMMLTFWDDAAAAAVDQGPVGTGMAVDYGPAATGGFDPNSSCGGLF